MFLKIFIVILFRILYLKERVLEYVWRTLQFCFSFVRFKELDFKWTKIVIKKVFQIKCSFMKIPSCSLPFFRLRFFEFLFNTLPTFIVLLIEFHASLFAPFGNRHAERRFEHECLCAHSNFFRFQFSIGSTFEATLVRSMRCHHWMQCGTARIETTLFRFILTKDQAHEFRHAIAYEWNESISNDIIKIRTKFVEKGRKALTMVIGWPKRVLLHRPTWWKNYKIGNRCARLLTLTG